MRTTRTEPSALLALMLAVIVLLAARWQTPSLSYLLLVAGVLIGVGTTLAVVQIRPRWFLAGRTSEAGRRLDEIRAELAEELDRLSRAPERRERATVPPEIRMIPPRRKGRQAA